MNASASEPPSPYRHSRSRSRRIEIGVTSCLAGGVSALYFLGDQANNVAQMDASVPTFGGGWATVAALIGLMVLYGLFVAAESAIDLLRPLHIRLVREENPKRADKLEALHSKQSRYVAVSAVGADFTRTAIVFVGLFLAPGVSKWLQTSAGFPDDFKTLVLAAILVAIPISILNLVGSLVPRSFASARPHLMAGRLYGFIRIFYWVLAIPASLVTQLAVAVAGFIGTKANFAFANQAEEEIKILAESAQKSGQIERDEKELLHSVFEFTDTVAREVMTPRVDMEALPVDSDPAAVLHLIRESGRSRIPLYEGTDDQIVGVVHAKDLLAAMVDGQKINLRRLMRDPYFVPEGKPLQDLLKDMKGKKTQIAIVQDEFGGTAGVVTVEDIVEELVGDIVDEYDDEEPEIVEIEDGWKIDGRTHLDDVNQRIGSALESEEFDTIGGYVFGLLGRQPKIGETISDSGFLFETLDTDGRRLKSLRVQAEQTEESRVAETMDA